MTIKTIEEATASLSGSSSHDLQGHVTAACAREISLKVDALTRQLDENEKASDRLGKKILWLNGLLFAATAIGAFATWRIAFPMA